MSNTNTFAPAPSTLVLEKISLPRNSSITVVGAGAFGGWTSLLLLRSGFRVTLVDAWGAGNSRSSSGDETRVIRSTYGANEFYFDLNVRALELWKEHEIRWRRQLFFNQGVLWFCYQEKSPLVDESVPFSKKHKMEYRYLTLTDLQKEYPMINCEGLHHAWLDPHGGYLRARESCLAVNESFVREGGEYILASAKFRKGSSGRMEGLELSNGGKISTDAYVFACGSWLGNLFPEMLNGRFTCTKQEVYYFGVPEEATRAYEDMPVWIDLDGHDFYYGIPSNANRGFKIGVDLRGEPFDPTNGDRMLDPNTLALARKFVGRRFPGLKNAPLLESRVCPYENSVDGNFIF